MLETGTDDSALQEATTRWRERLNEAKSRLESVRDSVMEAEQEWGGIHTPDSAVAYQKALSEELALAEYVRVLRSIPICCWTESCRTKATEV